MMEFINIMSNYLDSHTSIRFFRIEEKKIGETNLFLFHEVVWKLPLLTMVPFITRLKADNPHPTIKYEDAAIYKK